MERLVFCPVDGDLEKAEALGEEYRLPVLVGDNESTKNLDFDRNEIQVVFIPTIQKIIVRPTICSVGQTVKIEYIDEFDPLDDVLFKIVAPSGHTEVRKTFLTGLKECIALKFRTLEVGKYFGEIFDDEGVIATFQFQVRP